MNFNETHYIQFPKRNSPQIDLDISYANKLIFKAFDTKFLGIYTDSTLSWKIHIEQITHKSSVAWYTVRSFKPFMLQETLQMVYCTYLHSVMNCGLIFWGNCSHSARTFKIQKIKNYYRMQKLTHVEIYLRI